MSAAEVSTWLTVGFFAVSFIAVLKLLGLSPVGELVPGLRQFTQFI
jgi:hypothetical protein